MFLSVAFLSGKEGLCHASSFIPDGPRIHSAWATHVKDFSISPSYMLMDPLDCSINYNLSHISKLNRVLLIDSFENWCALQASLVYIAKILNLLIRTLNWRTCAHSIIKRTLCSMRSKEIFEVNAQLLNVWQGSTS